MALVERKWFYAMSRMVVMLAEGILVRHLPV